MRGNPLEVPGLDFYRGDIAELKGTVNLLRVLQADLLYRAVHIFNHFLFGYDVVVACIRIYGNRHIICSPEVFLAGRKQRLLNCLQKSILADILFSLQNIQCFK